jgi:hypothetical protein
MNLRFQQLQLHINQGRARRLGAPRAQSTHPKAHGHHLRKTIAKSLIAKSHVDLPHTPHYKVAVTGFNRIQHRVLFMATLRVGMIGYRFMGKAHSNAWRQEPPIPEIGNQSSTTPVHKTAVKSDGPNVILFPGPTNGKNPRCRQKANGKSVSSHVGNKDEGDMLYFRHATEVVVRVDISNSFLTSETLGELSMLGIKSRFWDYLEKLVDDCNPRSQKRLGDGCQITFGSAEEGLFVATSLLREMYRLGINVHAAITFGPLVIDKYNERQGRPLDLCAIIEKCHFARIPGKSAKRFAPVRIVVDARFRATLTRSQSRWLKFVGYLPLKGSKAPERLYLLDWQHYDCRHPAFHAA